MTDFATLVASRESCRDFADRSVTKEQLRNLIETAALAPSACNSQPWQFCAVTAPDLLPKIAKATQGMGMNKFTDKAPAFIVVVEGESNLTARLGGKLKDQQFSQIDLGIATAHLCLQATDLGLSTCILGWFNEKTLKDLLNIPEERRIRLVVAVGYAASETLRKKSRKPHEDVAVYFD
ncbi:MAG: nitroreductase family protein [Clostridia bacterium]|nr:nitroreductase family protein [Clostridia bacterium]